MHNPLPLTCGFLALAFLLAPHDRCWAQGGERPPGQPVGFTPEFEAENRPIAFPGAERPSGMYFSSAGPTEARCVAYSQDGRTLAVGDGPTHPMCTMGGPSPINENGGLIRLVDSATRRVRMTLRPRKLPRREYRVDSLLFSEDGKTLVSLGQEAYPEARPGRMKWDSHLTLWDLATGQPLNSIVDRDIRPYMHRTLSRDGKHYARAMEDGTIRVAATSTGWTVATLGERCKLGHYSFKELAFSPNGRILAAGDSHGEVELWDVMTGGRLARFASHRKDGELYGIRGVAISPDGRILVTRGSLMRQEAGEWKIHTELRFFGIPGLEERAARRLSDDEMLYCMQFSPDGRTLATGGPQAVVRLWDTAQFRERASFKKHDSWLLSLAFSPDGKVLAAGDRSTITLWDPATGAERAHLQRHHDDIRSLDFSPDSKTLASAGEDLKIWDLLHAASPRPNERARAAP